MARLSALARLHLSARGGASGVVGGGDAASPSAASALQKCLQPLAPHLLRHWLAAVKDHVVLAQVCVCVKVLIRLCCFL